MMDATDGQSGPPTPNDPLAAIPPENRQRLKQLADEELAHEQRRLYWVKRLSIVFAALLAIYLVALLLGLPGHR